MGPVGLLHNYEIEINGILAVERKRSVDYKRGVRESKFWDVKMARTSLTPSTKGSLLSTREGRRLSCSPIASPLLVTPEIRRYSNSPLPTSQFGGVFLDKPKSTNRASSAPPERRHSATPSSQVFSKPPLPAFGTAIPLDAEDNRYNKTRRKSKDYIPFPLDVGKIIGIPCNTLPALLGSIIQESIPMNNSNRTSTAAVRMFLDLKNRENSRDGIFIPKCFTIDRCKVAITYGSEVEDMRCVCLGRMVSKESASIKYKTTIAVPVAAQRRQALSKRGYLQQGKIFVIPLVVIQYRFQTVVARKRQKSPSEIISQHQRAETNFPSTASERGIRKSCDFTPYEYTTTWRVSIKDLLKSPKDAVKANYGKLFTLDEPDTEVLEKLLGSCERGSCTIEMEDEFGVPKLRNSFLFGG